MPQEALAGHDTYWTTLGNGQRRAVLVHCALADHGAWRGVARELGAAADLRAFDMPGHGKSAPWDGQSDLQGLVAEIACALAGDAEGVDLIGHSFGATAALRAAHLMPGQVRSLTLIEPVFMVAALRANSLLQDLYTRDMAEFQAAWEKGDRHAAAKAFTEVWGGGMPWEALPEVAKDMLASRIHLIPAAYDALHHDPAEVLGAGKLEALDCPVLLLEGSSTYWLVSHIHDALIGRFRHGARAIVGGAGHMLPSTHGDSVAREILRHCFV